MLPVALSRVSSGQLFYCYLRRCDVGFHRVGVQCKGKAFPSQRPRHGLAWQGSFDSVTDIFQSSSFPAFARPGWTISASVVGIATSRLGS